MNGCNNWHPQKSVQCVRGAHSFKSGCVGRVESEMLSSEWLGQTVFVITNGDYPAGVMVDKTEAEKLVNKNNLDTQKATGDRLSGYWRMHAFTIGGEIHGPDLTHLRSNRRTLATDLHEDR